MKNMHKSQPKQAGGQGMIPKVQSGKNQPSKKKQLPELPGHTSEEKFRRLFEAAQDGILLLDAETGIISDVNPFVIEFLGYPRTELIGKKLWETGPFRDVLASQNAFLKLQKKSYPCYEDLLLETKDGQQRNVEFLSDVYQVGSQKIIQCNIHDITERKRTEQSINRRNRHLQAISDANQVIVRATDEANLLNGVCQSIVKVGGYRFAWVGFAEQDRAKSVRPAAFYGIEEGYLNTANITWGNTKRGDGPTGKAICTGKTVIAQNILEEPGFDPWRNQALQSGYAASIAVPLIFDGRCQGALNIYADEPQAFDAHEVKMLEELALNLVYGISTLHTRSAREQAESALRESEQRYRTLAEAAHDMIFVIDRQGRVEYVNEFATRAIAREAKEIIGKPLIEFFPLETAHRQQQNIQQVFKTGQPVYYEGQTDFPQRTLWLDTWLTSIKNSAGEVVSVLGISRDITERKLVEKLQDVIYRIAHAADQAESLETLYPSIHASIREVMAADNFYIAIYDEKNNLLSFPYFVDEEDFPVPPQKPSRGLTEYVLRTGKSVLCDDALSDELIQRGEVELVGANSAIWLGVPLIVEGKTIGVMVVQNYKNVRAYGEREQRILEFVSSQAAMAIYRKRFEENLRESRHMLRLVLDTIPVRVFWKDCDSNFLGCNQPFALDSGLHSPEELIGKNDYAMGWKEQADFYRADDRQVIETGQPKLNYEEPQTTPDGGQIWLRTSKIPLQNVEGQITGVLGTYEDITERKQAEQAQQQSENLFRGLFELSPDAIVLIDPHDPNVSWPIVDCNAMACKMSGYRRDELIGHSIDILNGNRGTKAERSAYMKKLRKAGILNLETLHRHKNGTMFPIEISTTLIKVGESELVIGIDRDITERKRAEEALHKDEQRLASIYDTVGDVIFYLAVEPDEQYRFSSVNPAFCRVTGLPFEQVVGKKVNEVIPEPSLSMVLGKYRQAIEEKTIVRWEEISDYPNGRLTGEVSVAPVIDDAGKCTHLVGAVHDITGRKRVEEELRLGMEQLIALNQASQAVTTSLDLNQVLTEVMSLASKVVGSEYTSVVLVDEVGQISRAVENVPGELSIERRARQRGFTNWILRTRRPVVVDEIGEAGVVRPGVGGRAPRTANPQLLAKGIKSFVGLPLVVKDHGVGVLYLHSLRPGTFHDQLTLLTTFANQAAIAIENARLYEKVQKELAERKRAEQTLANERNLLRSLIDNAPDSVYVKDTECRVLLANMACARRAGLSTPEDMLGKTDFDYFPQELAARYFADDQEVLRSGQPLLEHEEPSIDAAGNPKWISTNKVPLRDDQGKIYGLVGMGRDITGRKKAEDDLRKSEEKFRKAFIISPDSININRLKDGMYIAINNGFTQIMGYTEAECIGKTSIELNIWANSEDRNRLVDDLIKNGEVANLEARFCAKNGDIKYGLMSASIQELNNIPHIISITRDITERKQAAEALERRDKELRQRNEELARLYRASGSLISEGSLNLQEQARKIIEIVQQEFGQAYCSLLILQKDSGELVDIVASGLYANQVRYQKLTLDGPGLIPLAIRTNKVVNIGDVHSASEYVQGWDAAQSELVVPLRVGNENIGAIDLESAQPNDFSPDDERLVTIFAERAALALEHSLLYGQIEARVQQLAALRTIDMAISSSSDIYLTLGILLDQLKAQLGVHAADILVYNPVTQTFQFSCGQGFRTQTLQHTQLRLGEGLAGRAALQRQLLKVPDLRAEPSGLGKSSLFLKENFVGYVGIPLIAKGQVKGVLELFQREPFELNSDQQAFLEATAGQAGIAIDNAELFDHLQTSIADLKVAYDSTLEGWASALELRDKETEGHTRRVTEQTRRLAQALGVKDDDMLHIYRGALLHDIGKIGVPDGIVLKPGSLTEQEWEIMRKHPIYAYNMLSPIGYLREALNIPYCHHERWDGTGYPRGLKGEEIPLAARIFSVVDVWDALTSDRPYRKAWTQEQAKAYLLEQAGRQFDPKVVKIFFREGLNV